jgi:hypothetical protein
MNITSSKDVKVFFIDDDKVMIEGRMFYDEKPTSHNSDYAKCEKVACIIDNQVNNMSYDDILETLKKHFA